MNLLRDRRLGGATLLTGGLLTTLGYLIVPSDARNSWIVPAAALILAGVVLLMAGLPAFHVHQAERAGRAGRWGTVLCCLGIALADLPLGVLGTFDHHALVDTDAYHASLLGTLQFLGLPVIGVGVILLTIATRRARVYPAWTWWAFVTILALSAVCIFIPGLSSALRYPAEDFLLVGALGIALRGQAAAPVGTIAAPAAVT
jgi:hypothetical protein